jgi:hypothetical protein
MPDDGDLHELRALATTLAQLRQADILIFSGDLARPSDGSMSVERREQPQLPNCLLVLCTLGGSTEAAFRLARTLRRDYRHLTVYIDDYCKGAGMLLALTADDLVISDFGELGPLDLVSQRAVIPGRGDSGRAHVQALRALRAEAESSFEEYLARFRSRSLAMTSRSAIEQASALAIGLMGPVFAQVDPLHVAEADRAKTTATLYVQRLGGNHLKEGALERLLTGYPSHDFVVDREEASDLLRTVRAPTPDESDFLTQIEPIVTQRRFRSRLLRLDEALAVAASPERNQPGVSQESARAERATNGPGTTDGPGATTETEDPAHESPG